MDDDFDDEILDEVKSRTVDANVERAIEAAEQYWHRHGGEELEELRAIVTWLGELASGNPKAVVSVSKSNVLVGWATVEKRFPEILDGVYTQLEVNEDLKLLRDSLPFSGPVPFAELESSFQAIFGELDEALVEKLHLVLVESTVRVRSPQK